MEWRDVGIVLSARPHGEGGAIASLLTASHGRHAGLVPAGRSRSRRATLEPGTLLTCRWGARLESHLGRFTCEPVESSASLLLGDPRRLSVLNAFCALADWALPERLPCPDLYDASLALLVALQGEGWAAAYVHWEMLLLAETGFPLDLSACAATGRQDELVWVSPRSGRAVCREAGRPYADRLLPLPAFLLPEPPVDMEWPEQWDHPDICTGLALTGYFLQQHLQVTVGKPLPWARGHLVSRLQTVDR
ncbi:DNA repair protein RecO [Insolitispirillum peregrinum]|uniref:DNA repair protein RecO n=1 Tax=Insolitispirillum peregrinum TaxID=80876 RepID=UPI00361511ED